MSSITLNVGRGLMVLANLLYSGGAFFFDWNETHIFNPRWPPHARFHNGQTMSLGIGLTLVVLYFLFRPATSNVSAAQGKSRDKRDDLFSAVIVGSLYCACGLTAIWYPGSDWTDPEFEYTRVNLKVFSTQLVMNWVGYTLANASLGAGKDKSL